MFAKVSHRGCLAQATSATRLLFCVAVHPGHLKGRCMEAPQSDCISVDGHAEESRSFHFSVMWPFYVCILIPKNIWEKTARAAAWASWWWQPVL